MNTSTRISHAERFGRRLGRGWRAYARGERRLLAWLAALGFSAGAATVLLWALKLTVLGVLLYAVFWLALLLLFLVAVAIGNADAVPKTPEPEWRHGHAGFGLYTDDEHRIDPHDPSDDT
jgi:hypothetical protein